MRNVLGSFIDLKPKRDARIDWISKIEWKKYTYFNKSKLEAV